MTRRTGILRAGSGAIDKRPPSCQGVHGAAEAFLEADARLEAEHCAGGADVRNDVTGASIKEFLSEYKRLGEELDGIAIICKNVTPLVVELQRVRNAGKPVLAVVSDLERSARSAYLGIDNRAAGQMAAYLLGRHLECRIDASVAVVVGNVSYRCHEDREIGFRSLLRQKFSNIELLEVVGNDSSETAYIATRKLFATKPNLAGLYNVAGGNRGLAQALSDMKLTYRPLYITHELNQVTEPLLREERIDYLLTQDLDKLLQRTKRLLQEAVDQSRDLPEVNHLPIRLLTQFHLNSDRSMEGT